MQTRTRVCVPSCVLSNILTLWPQSISFTQAPYLCHPINNTRVLIGWFKCATFFLRFSLFTFRETGREGEREGEKQQCGRKNINRLPLAHPQPGTWPATQTRAVTGN